MSLQFKNISLYNDYWLRGVRLNPITVLIGGYCGTGKSIRAIELTKNYQYFRNVSSDLVRSVLRSIITLESNPSLHHHTYDLHEINNNVEPLEKRVIQNMIFQCKPICEAINEYIKFIQTEKQSTVIEGPQILPSLISYDKKCIVVEAYYKVDDEKTHLSFMSGPTHNRIVTPLQFRTARILQEYILNEAKRLNKPIIDYKNSYSDLLSLIDNQVKDYLNSL